MNIKGQGHSLTLVQCQSESTFSNFFSLETAMAVETKFHVDPSWDGGKKVQVMTNMAAMFIYVKNLKHIFFSGTKRPMILKVAM